MARSGLDDALQSGELGHVDEVETETCGTLEEPLRFIRAKGIRLPRSGLGAFNSGISLCVANEGWTESSNSSKNVSGHTA